MSASWPHESFFFLSPLIYNYLDIHNQAQVIFTQHTRIPEGSSHLYIWKWVDWTSEEAAEPREWWHRLWQSCWQRRWWVKEVSGNLPSHTCCSWRDPLLSLRRDCSAWGEGREREEENWRECISFYLPWIQQEVRQQTSGAPQLEDHCSGRWAHPKPMC